MDRAVFASPHVPALHPALGARAAREVPAGACEAANGALTPDARTWSRVEAFRAALEGRGCFPEVRIQEFRGLSDTDLRAAVENTRAVRERLSRVLAGCNLTGRRTLDLALFSCDHRWRTIADGLNRLGPAWDATVMECWALALTSYIDYLGSREARLRGLLRARPRVAVHRGGDVEHARARWRRV